MKKIIFSFLILFCGLIAESNAQRLLATSIGTTLDTVAATTADDTSRGFLNSRLGGSQGVFLEFYSGSEWRVAKVDYPRATQYRAVYRTSDSTYVVQIKVSETTGSQWFTVPITFYSTQTIRATVILKTAVSWIRFRYYN